MVKNNVKVTKKEADTTDSENSCQTSSNQKPAARKEHTQQYLNLFADECQYDLSQLEQSAVSKLFSCFQQDMDISRKLSTRKVSIITRMDSQHFFTTLCL